MTVGLPTALRGHAWAMARQLEYSWVNPSDMTLITVIKSRKVLIFSGRLSNVDFKYTSANSLFNNIFIIAMAYVLRHRDCRLLRISARLS